MAACVGCWLFQLRFLEVEVFLSLGSYYGESRYRDNVLLAHGQIEVRFEERISAPLCAWAVLQLHGEQPGMQALQVRICFKDI